MVLNCSDKGLLVLLSVIIIASRAVLLDIFSGNFKKIQKLEAFETVHKHLSPRHKCQLSPCFCFLNSKFPFMSHPFPLSLKKKKQATSDLMQGNQYRIFAVVQVEATQKFISPQYLKFDLCDTGALFYQLRAIRSTGR